MQKMCSHPQIKYQFHLDWDITMKVYISYFLTPFFIPFRDEVWRVFVPHHTPIYIIFLLICQYLLLNLFLISSYIPPRTHSSCYTTPEFSWVIDSFKYNITLNNILSSSIIICSSAFHFRKSSSCHIIQQIISLVIIKDIFWFSN